MPSVRLVGLAPSEPMTTTSLSVPSRTLCMAIFDPSGDQLGAASYEVLLVMLVGSVPSESIKKISLSPSRLLMKAILLPSGE